MPDSFNIAIGLLVFVFGAIIGSFLNVVILRLPAEKRLSGRSACMQCGRRLSAISLVPLFSWLWQKGKCLNCKKPVSPRYFYIELISAALSVVVFFWYAPNDTLSWLMCLRALFVTYVLLVVFVIDLEHFLILDKVIFPACLVLVILNAVLSWLSASYAIFWQGLAAAAVGSALFYGLWFFTQGRALGFGDVKFMLFMGLALLWPGVLIGMLFGFYIGALAAVPLLILKRKKLHSKLPFGTFLSIACFMVLLWGENLFSWYLGLFGL